MKKQEKQDGEDFNVRTEHGQIMREFSRPEVYRAIPWWLKHGLYWPLFLWFPWYLTMYFGGFDSEEYYEGHIPIYYDTILQKEKAAEEAQTLTPPSSASVSTLPDGGKIYTTVCAVCHQPNGQGLAGVFPPLTESDWVSGKEQVLAAIVLHGLQGEISVNGTAYNGIMPPQGAVLKDADIAAALTHIRSSWGNAAPPVRAETVAKIRGDHPERGPWTKAELDSSFKD